MRTELQISQEMQVMHAHTVLNSELENRVEVNGHQWKIELKDVNSI